MHNTEPIDPMRPAEPYVDFWELAGGKTIGETSIIGTSIIGIGGAPTRATTFPHDAAGRKQHPVASGVLDYFPDALVAVSEISYAGNEQHNPGQPLNWARGKSADEADALIRHFLQRGLLDDDGKRHSAKMVWRALALLQKEIEATSHAARTSNPTT